MGISFARNELESRLEEAVALAERGRELPSTWTTRTERIGECPSKSYVAALGTALLAKATDDSVDVLTVKAGVAPRAYSMRGVVGTLAGRASDYGYHLGRTGPEPLNNQPWFGGKRIDQFDTVRADARPFHREFVRWMRDLNKMDSEDALGGLAAFVRVRQQYAEDQSKEVRELAGIPRPFAEVVSAATRFINDDPEGGRRGQALVAALLDCAFDDVMLAGINDPRPLDVATKVDGELDLPVEVKQKPASESTVLHLAEEAAKSGVDKALLAALAPNQTPIDRESAALRAAEEYGVLATVVESVSELFAQVATWSGTSAATLAGEFPEHYARRMREHEVSAEGRNYWVDLVADLKPLGSH